ncbi:hypothetical protein DPMN_098227 [Dreissena polymorpha]|uniref:Uncharacterized protein n=1 Tax=Dreissena polymorpha TaxID=45954 RepID=A0A9D4LEB0_DREPO|nr:hypothetical protein DPMN_098227 [Dreissena polymorpha]
MDCYGGILAQVPVLLPWRSGYGVSDMAVIGSIVYISPKDTKFLFYPGNGL